MSEVIRDLIIDALVRKRLRHLGPNPCCETCGETRPWRLEAHHPDGRKNSDRIQILCRNHHADETFEQRVMAAMRRHDDAMPI